MIEVNLLPGGKKRAGRRARKGITMPKIGGLPSDRWILGSAAVVVLCVVLVVVLFVTRSGRYGNLDAAVQEAAADSARYADLIQQAERLRARRDSIAERVDIIQEIDKDRYVWPHLMDEIGRALPDYTWLTNVVQTSLNQELRLRLEGRAGTNFALTTFMENLEASPYLRGVTLVNTQLTVESQGGVSRSVNSFVLEASYEDPPLEMRQTVPLLEEGTAPPVRSRPDANPTASRGEPSSTGASGAGASPVPSVGG